MRLVLLDRNSRASQPYVIARYVAFLFMLLRSSNLFKGAMLPGHMCVLLDIPSQDDNMVW